MSAILFSFFPHGCKKWQCLKQIQGLPDNTSNSACLALLGILPIEVVLHKNLLNMYVNMIRNDNSIEYEIAHRQLVMIDPQQKSLFNYIRDILNLYELPSIFSLLNNPPTKEEWKGSSLISQRICVITQFN